MLAYTSHSSTLLSVSFLSARSAKLKHQFFDQEISRSLCEPLHTYYSIHSGQRQGYAFTCLHPSTTLFDRFPAYGSLLISIFFSHLKNRFGGQVQTHEIDVSRLDKRLDNKDNVFFNSVTVALINSYLVLDVSHGFVSECAASRTHGPPPVVQETCNLRPRFPHKISESSRAVVPLGSIVFGTTKAEEQGYRLSAGHATSLNRSPSKHASTRRRRRRS